VWATTATGQVLPAGAAPNLGGLRRGTTDRVVGITAADGRGYLLATSDGRVFAFGDARRRGSPASLGLGTPIVGISATADGDGYWLAGADGGIFAFGDAVFRGTGRWQRPSGPYGAVAPPPGPTAGVVDRPGSDTGYWVFGTTGRVVERGDAHQFGGDNNLALFTQ
jgi:hypothetical protein